MSTPSELICEAIENKNIIIFVYLGSQRVVEPHLLGINKSDHLILRAWQLSGGSGQGWRPFRLDRLSGLVIIEDNFPGPRSGYNSDDSNMLSIRCRLRSPTIV